ncbi:DNA polymerase theta [Pectinophora gossypiella]|uniref:DNA polymerase theta n=1 Tax=Pectinophora gossypiella TaxID=13191 RepID=UPI00214EEA51|nr:DNA polymerase theta [Pectinophora gossypiella]
MADEGAEVIDSQIIAENVGFLDNCFDNSFALQSSIIVVKEYVAEGQNEQSSQKLYGVKSSKNIPTVKKNQSIVFNSSTSTNAEFVSQIIEKDKVVNKNLKAWGLPQDIARKYEERGIQEMFDWQVSCLGNPKVLMDCCNLVYSAPTSAGKTLVAEILTIKTILERQKKVIIILPFVSIVREKMFYLQDILSSSGIRVEGFMGSQSPPGGLQAVHVAVCTIEKANSLVNRLLDDGNISELGAVVVDELHLLGDPHRGYILELLLTKIKYVSSKLDDVQIQVVGMSATLPNLEVLAHWLEAELYITQFRPIPLDEFCLIGNKLYDKCGKCIDTIDNKVVEDGDNVLKICLNTIKEECSVLIFCMTKNRCENLAQSIAGSFYKLGCSGNEMGQVLRQQLKSDSISEVLEQLKNCPVSLDQILKNTISFGVAYHHAGLTFDERDIIEGGFKSGAIRVLVATSTLSSGVNLPARKVIIRSPVFQRHPINILTYKQMIGRAGRMGRDTKGESILICTEAEKQIGFDLMMGALDPVKSCIESEDKYMRAVLEMIASQVACTKAELDLYSKCTLLFTQQNTTPSQNELLDNTLEELRNYELVRIQDDGDEKKFVATPLGKACLSSSMAPNDGLSLFCELQKARQCLVLETDLHLIYLVTPYSVSSQWGDIDWLHLLTLWESLTKAMKRVGELVGVQESFIIRCLRGINKMNNVHNKLNIHKRFYTALALQDLVNEVPLSEVAGKFQCARGFLQSLQQAAAAFAGMVTAFCHQLGWKNMEMLISQFQDRLHFGIHSELLDLMKLPSLNGMRARTLFDAGFETVSSIASAEVNTVENALYKAVPFQSEKEREDDDSDDMRKRKKMKNVWITGCCGMTTKEAAENLVMEARKYLEHEIGVKEIKWDTLAGCRNSTQQSSKDEHGTNKSSCSTPITVNENIQKSETLILEEGNKPSEASRNNHSLTNRDVKTELLTEETDTISRKSYENDSENIYHSANYFKSSDVKNELKKSIIDDNLVDSLISNNELEFMNKTSSPIINGMKREKSKLKSPLLKDVTNIKHSPSILKDDIIWDSMNFTEVAIENVTKFQNVEKMYSPNISFGECDEKLEPVSETTTSTKSTVKDISLFSSEGDNSSLFEESLPIDLIPSKLLDDKFTQIQITKPIKQETASDFISMNSNSILNAFKSTIVEVDDECDEIKLVYEEDNKLSENESESGFNLSEDVVIETQDINVSPIKDSFKSPFKRHNSYKDTTQPSAKKVKTGTDTDILPISTTKSDDDSFALKMNCPESKMFTLEIRKQKIKCFILKRNDILNNFEVIDSNKEAAIYLNVKAPTAPTNEVIGSNIVKTRPQTANTSILIQGIAVYLGKDTCVFLDFTNIGDLFTSVKNKLAIWLQRKNTKLKVMSLKSDYVNIKKCFNIDVLASLFDVSLAEWLVDSDEKIPNLVYLTKKYCDVDLTTVSLKVNNRVKRYQHLDTIEACCLKTWSIWNVAEKEVQYLLAQYENVRSIISIEFQISKILADCEYYGLAVDKQLASQLLIDVKDSQEHLQRRAYQMCGYHFNFNSAKDVAKVLGLYKGRKVSTKKSVLTSHNSPMASLVIYWRKLNSILTKTLYPLTEKACIYSDGNRINPSYTMFTCTGRISMHEPNLQSVPRTFSIPTSYLDSQPSTDIIEFNCRNIFQAAPGYVLVSADYCQLEMRILTHYCEDEVLMRIMRSDVDVFKAIAASWGNVAEDEVDDDLRQRAKQLCYGILYGMGNRTLSQQLEVSEMEAAVFMDTFYRSYPGIRRLTGRLLEDCRRRGYVETLMRRRRYLPDINSQVLARKSAAERQAVNTTIQGSAADIAKAAMCAIDTRTNTHVHKPRLILQMHDELIYEVPKNNKNDFVKILKEVMERTVKLNVPLPVKVRSGNTWGSLQEIKF